MLYKGDFVPGYRVHLIGGFTAYVFLLYFMQALKPTPLTMIEWLSLSLIGSLFPDVDTKSRGQLWFFRFIVVILLAFVVHKRFVIAVMISLASCVPLLVRHRGLFHRPWFMISIPFVGVFIISLYMPHYASLCYYDALFFVVGALSHLWLDLGTIKLFK